VTGKHVFIDDPKFLTRRFMSLSMHTGLKLSLTVGLFVLIQGAQAQNPAIGAPGNGGPGGSAQFQPAKTDHYNSELVKLGGDADDALLFVPVKQGGNPRVAVVTTYQPPASELADRGYHTLLIRHVNRPGEVSTPFDGFDEISRGIAYMRAQPGIQKVVVAAWGGGSTTMILYADVAGRGPSACQAKGIIDPCRTEAVAKLAKPDGVILLDPSLGGAYKVLNIDPAYDGTSRTNADLDMFNAANGYDSSTGTANYSGEFRKKYFEAQSDRNNQIVERALARIKQLGPGQDEPFTVPGGVNAADLASLHHTDLSILAHTKEPHTLLKADGTRPVVIIKSLRTTLGPVGDDALKKALAQNDHPRNNETLRQYLANDAVHTEKNYALTEDDVLGIDWKTSNAASPAQAEGITVPTLVMTNTCFQFVVPSEIVFDHLASKDKTYAGVEGSLHFFNPCEPQYGDTKKRLFDYVDDWLAQPKRF
jgi:hypothetical protein